MRDSARTPKEKREASLEISFMGTLPAYGFYGRNVRGLSIRDCTFDVETPDARPAIVLNDVKGGRIEGFGAGSVVQKNSSEIILLP